MKTPSISNKVAVALLTLIFLASCSRPESKSAKVTFEIPELTEEANTQKTSNYIDYLTNISSVENNQILTSDVNALLNDELYTEWSSTQVTGYSGPGKLNCFFITASSNENPFRCFKNGSERFSYNISAGPTRSGSELQLEVYAGPNQKFRLMGMHSETPDDCRKFSDGLFMKSKLSRPIVVGESDAVEIVSGRENQVYITVKPYSLTKSDYVDHCTENAFKAFPRDVSKIEFRLDNGLFGQSTYLNQCVPVTVKYRSADDIAYVPSKFAGDHRIVNSGTPVVTYESAKDCIANAAGSMTFSSLGKIETVRWLKGYSQMKGFNNFHLEGISNNVTSATTSASFSNLVGSETLQADSLDVGTFRGSSTSSDVGIILVPHKINLNVCTPITITKGYMAGTPANYGFAVGDSIWINFIPAEVAGVKDISFYSSEANCLSSTATSTDSFSLVSSWPTSSSHYTTWIKAKEFLNGERVHMTLSTLPVTPPTSATTTVDLHMHTPLVLNSSIIGGPDVGSSSYFKTLQIVGPRFAHKDSSPGSWPRCIGPYRVYVGDLDGAYVKETTGRNLKVFYENIGTSSTVVYRADYISSAQCSDANKVEPNGILTLPSTTGFVDFYVGVGDPDTLSQSVPSTYYKYIRVYDDSISPVLTATHLLTVHSASMTTTVPSPPSLPGSAGSSIADEIDIGP